MTSWDLGLTQKPDALSCASIPVVQRLAPTPQSLHGMTALFLPHLPFDVCSLSWVFPSTFVCLCLALCILAPSLPCSGTPRSFYPAVYILDPALQGSLFLSCSLKCLPISPPCRKDLSAFRGRTSGVWPCALMSFYTSPLLHTQSTYSPPCR